MSSSVSSQDMDLLTGSAPKLDRTSLVLIVTQHQPRLFGRARGVRADPELFWISAAVASAHPDVDFVEEGAELVRCGVAASALLGDVELCPQLARLKLVVLIEPAAIPVDDGRAELEHAPVPLVG